MNDATQIEGRGRVNLDSHETKAESQPIGWSLAFFSKACLRYRQHFLKHTAAFTD
jgi:hypothetical protein